MVLTKTEKKQLD